MTFHESYGSLPTKLLRKYRAANVSPADHDSLLAVFNWTWDSPNIDWDMVSDYLDLHIRDGIYRPGRYSL